MISSGSDQILWNLKGGGFDSKLVSRVENASGFVVVEEFSSFGERRWWWWRESGVLRLMGSLEAEEEEEGLKGRCCGTGVESMAMFWFKKARGLISRLEGIWTFEFGE